MRQLRPWVGAAPEWAVHLGPGAAAPRRRFRFRFLASAGVGSRGGAARGRTAGGASGHGGQRVAAMALAVEALRVLCASGGCLEQSELRRRLPGRPTAEKLALVLGDTQRFTLVDRRGEAGAAAAQVVAVATSPVRLCQEHGAGCEGQCGRLHLCKYHLKGLCRNQQAR